MTTPPQPGYGYQPVPQEVCAFHPDRPTGLHCTRCGRPACPECLTPASVGFHCRACVAEAKGTQRVPKTVAGGRLRQQPVVTSVLIAINIVVFAITAAQSKSLTQPGGSVFDHGADVPDLVAHGEYWRLFTSGFLHLSLEHIALNMVSLYIVGLPLERVLGRGRFIAVYLVSMLGGAVAVQLIAPSLTIAAGASGAIFGLLGALLMAFRQMRLDPRQLIVVIVINLVISFSIPHISWQDHIGGLIIGAAMGAIMVYPPAKTRRAWQVGGTVGVVVLLAVIIAIQIAARAPEFCSLEANYFYRCGT